MFFVGATNVLLAMGWWAMWLADARWQVFGLRQPQPWAGWLHAFVMQYQVFPSFIFGFLLTVFPKWMGLPDIPRSRYLPVGIGLFGGQLLAIAGAFGWAPGIELGFWLTLLGWLAGIATLGPMLWRERGTTWHARSIMAALVLGLLGLGLHGAFLYGGDAWLEFASIKVGSFGLLLPVYLTVAHQAIASRTLVAPTKNIRRCGACASMRGKASTKAAAPAADRRHLLEVAGRDVDACRAQAAEQFLLRHAGGNAHCRPAGIQVQQGSRVERGEFALDQFQSRRLAGNAKGVFHGLSAPRLRPRPATCPGWAPPRVAARTRPARTRRR